VKTAEAFQAAWHGGFDPIAAHEQAHPDGTPNKKANAMQTDTF